MRKPILVTSLISLQALAANEAPVKFGGFLDTYYAYDFNQPSNRDRQYTTQPSKHNEFNINLAYIEAVLNKEKTRGRLALQYGTSVDKNYAGEPNPDVKVVQEAFVGKKLGEKTWIDAGIFLGNIGAESWISRYNWTYTRSLNLDYVPYYSSGVRLEHQLDQKQSFQLQLLNGWQNISENNQGKAIGMQYKNVLSNKLTFTYNNFFGDEEVVPVDPRAAVAVTKPRFRSYHNFIFQWLANEKWKFLYTFDVGEQSQQQNSGVDPWWNTTLTVHRILNPQQFLSTRFEYYNDRHQSNVVTATHHGFQVTSASINFDQKLDESAMWRTELRGFYSKDEIYPAMVKSKNRLDGFLVTSLSMWF